MVLARLRNFSTRVKMAMYEYQLQWCVRGYYIYKEEWEVTVGEELKCEREKNKAKDPYAVAVFYLFFYDFTWDDPVNEEIPNST